MAVIIGVGKYAYQRKDGVYVIPMEVQKHCFGGAGALLCGYLKARLLSGDSITSQ